MADESNATPEASSEEPKPAASGEGGAPAAPPGEGATEARGGTPAASEGTTQTSEGAAETSGPATAAGEAASGDGAGTGTGGGAGGDPWAPYDAVLEPFATELRLGVGTACGEQWAEAEGRFLCWTNRSGWRCTLRLLRPPQENVVVLLVEGPPLPGGRARAMLLGGFPPELDAQTLRAALELGFGIGETWGPAEAPPPPTEEPRAGEPTNGGTAPKEK